MSPRCKIHVSVLMLVLAAMIASISISNAQVTFSRDWTAGKRSSISSASLTSGLSECGANFKSTIALCQMLVSELRQLATCEMRSQLNARDEDLLDQQPPPAFTSGHSGGR